MTDKTAGVLTETAGKSLFGYLKGNMRDYGMLVSLVLIVLFFQLMTIQGYDGYLDRLSALVDGRALEAFSQGKMLTSLNVTNVILQNSA